MTASHAGRCPVCSRTIRLPIGTVGKRVACRDCATILRIGAGSEGTLVLTPLGTKASGRPGPSRAVGEMPARSERHGRRQEPMQDEKGTRIGKVAHRVLLILAILFAVSGTVMGIRGLGDVRDARAILGSHEPERVIEVEGQRVAVGAVLRDMDTSVMLTFTIGYVLATVMLCLFFWARRSPYPALVTALCTYVGVILLGAILDPTSLVKGIEVKVIVIGVLVFGASAALRQRAALAPHRHRAARSPAFAG